MRNFALERQSQLWASQLIIERLEVDFGLANSSLRCSYVFDIVSRGRRLLRICREVRSVFESCSFGSEGMELREESILGDNGEDFLEHIDFDWGSARIPVHHAPRRKTPGRRHTR